MKIYEIPMDACGCLGPMYGEPHCPCIMRRLGLPLNTMAREAEEKRAKEELRKLFANGSPFFRQQKKENRGTS
ncbi:MAG: hypothetical protein JO253_03090 [Alphaproteobacteria bacterium]|nr:hypothetical protein [Alphaproteobacteria bacterium]